MRLTILLLLIAIATTRAQQQPDSTVNKKRLRTLAIASAVGYTAVMTGLHQVWYKDFARQDFHFFNDIPEWKQVDKAGHFFSSYYFSYGTSRALLWCNVPARQSNLVGAITGFAVLLPIEIFDGYSEAYGASGGDLLANTAGAALFLGQQRLWNEQRIIPRFSFRHTNFPPKRPEVLGDSPISELIKDYNGQTYWLSLDMDKLTTFPRWLNIAVGYGAHEMVYARDAANIIAGFTAYRQFYIGLDPDLSAIRTRSKVVKTLIFIAGMFKLPAPALEFSNGKTRFRALY